MDPKKAELSRSKGSEIVGLVSPNMSEVSHKGKPHFKCILGALPNTQAFTHALAFL